MVPHVKKNDVEPGLMEPSRWNQHLVIGFAGTDAMNEDNPRLRCVVLHHPTGQGDGFFRHLHRDVVPCIKEQRFKVRSQRLVLLMGDDAHVFVPEFHAEFVRGIAF